MLKKVTSLVVAGFDRIIKAKNMNNKKLSAECNNPKAAKLADFLLP
jgi:hypothetical protein